MEDIVPGLLEQIQREFEEQTARNKTITQFLNRIRDGTATFEDAQAYSSLLGRILSQVLQENLAEGVLPDGKLYWNIAQRIITPLLQKNFDLVNFSAEEVQKLLDQADGIGLKAVKAVMPDERIKGLLEYICAPEEFEEVQRRLGGPVQNITETFFDDFIQRNAAFRYKAGMNPQIIRTSGGEPCEWCSKLAGVYDYDSAPKDVYRRHDNCQCQVVYKNNKLGYMEDVHSKVTLEDKEVLELRKKYNLDLTRGLKKKKG